jgi:tRNA wybutosine-synthesizing protein 4
VQLLLVDREKVGQVASPEPQNSQHQNSRMCPSPRLYATCKSESTKVLSHPSHGYTNLWPFDHSLYNMGRPNSKEDQKIPSGVPTTKEKQDEAIIGTNDYSIVSKRSVEKIYLADEPEFLRPFVGKFKRRAPLINRGYWLRMKAIEQVVKNFLDEKTGKSKVIVNLGCGYEPLPFRMLWKYSSQCRGVRFVDVDYPQLIQKKVEIIRKNDIFSGLLSGSGSSTGNSAASSIFLRDENYCAVGCDLGDTKALDQVFRNELVLQEHSILFIGEVSIVYMEVQQADELIKWASGFEDGLYFTQRNVSL